MHVLLYFLGLLVNCFWNQTCLYISFASYLCLIWWIAAVSLVIDVKTFTCLHRSSSRRLMDSLLAHKLGLKDSNSLIHLDLVLSLVPSPEGQQTLDPKATNTRFSDSLIRLGFSDNTLEVGGLHLML